MPEAAAKALLVAAENAAQPTGGNQGAGTQTNAPSDAGHRPSRRRRPRRRRSDRRPGRRAAGATRRRSRRANPQPPGARGRGARAQPARDAAAGDRDRARSRRRGAGEPDPQRGSPRTDPGRASAHGAAGDARADHRGDQRAHGRAGRDVLPAGRPEPRAPGPARPRASTSERSNRRRRHERRAAAAAGDGRRQRRVPGHAAGRDRAGDAPRIHGRPAARRATAGAVADAVELLAEAGLSAEQTRALLDACRERAPQRWRERFWALAMRAACANAHHARANAGSSQVP